MAQTKMQKHGPHVSFVSDEGKEYLMQSNYSKYIVECRMKQIRGSTCGITSIGILLNAVIISSNDSDDDDDDGKGSHDNILYTESTLISTLSNYCDNIPPMDKLLRYGVTLDQLGCLIKNIGSTYVEIFHCNQLDPKTRIRMIKYFRSLIKNCFASKECINFGIICNFRVSILNHLENGPKWGHFSPIGGYHEKTDKILLLDTKNDSIWCDVESMWNAMNTKDSCGKYRGFILVIGLPNLKMQFSTNNIYYN